MTAEQINAERRAEIAVTIDGLERMLAILEGVQAAMLAAREEAKVITDQVHQEGKGAAFGSYYVQALHGTTIAVAINMAQRDLAFWRERQRKG